MMLLQQFDWEEGQIVGKKQKRWQSACLSRPLAGSYPQKLLVGDFPHELEVDEMEEDVPKRKNRTKARVGCQGQSIPEFFLHLKFFILWGYGNVFFSVNLSWSDKW